MNDITRTIDAYLEAYGEPDSARRVALIEQVWALDGELIDPPLDATGHSAISDMAAAVQAQFPGHSFRRTGEVTPTTASPATTGSSSLPTEP